MDIFGKESERLQKVVERQEKQIDSLTQERDDIRKIFEQLKSKRDELVKKNEENYQAYNKLENNQKKINEELNETKNLIKNLTVENKKLSKENAKNYEAFLQMKELRDKRVLELKELKEVSSSYQVDLVKAQKENHNNYEALKKAISLHENAQKKISDLSQDHKLFFLQLTQAKDELAKKNEELQKFTVLNQSLSGKLSRLLAKFGGQIDFGSLELIEVDSVSDVPQIVWKVSDYSTGNEAVPNFYFRTTLRDGLAGIGLIENPKDHSTLLSEPILIPSLIGSDAVQTDCFKGFSQHHWMQIIAAVIVLEQLVLSKGEKIYSTQDFDYSFWQNSFISLITSIKKLPVLLRYAKVKLKRELQNPDYEHLWLEFYDLEYETTRLPKFEMRIGAAALDPVNFSKFPKLEFPLIDNRIKPFDSWFAESVDDFGQKYELRFSIDDRSMDLNNFLKLTEVDQRFIQALIFVLPSTLKQLIRSKISIHRQWSAWLIFVESLSAIYQNQIRSFKPDLLQGKSASPRVSVEEKKTGSLGDEAIQTRAIPIVAVKSRRVTVDVQKKSVKKSSMQSKVSVVSRRKEAPKALNSMAITKKSVSRKVKS